MIEYVLTNIGTFWVRVKIGTFCLSGVEVEVILQVLIIVAMLMLVRVIEHLFSFLNKNLIANLESESTSDVSLFLLRLASVMSVMAILEPSRLSYVCKCLDINQASLTSHKCVHNSCHLRLLHELHGANLISAKEVWFIMLNLTLVINRTDPFF